METFGERLKAALLANGMEATPWNLARASKGRISVRQARQWLRLAEADVPASKLATISGPLGFRMAWLATGRGVPQITDRLMQFERDALRIAAILDDTSARAEWISDGLKRAKFQ